MNLFKRNKKEINLEDLEAIITSKIDKLAIAIKEKDFERERYLEDLAFNAKHEKIKEYEDIIKQIKNESNCRKTIIEQQQEDIEKLKTTNQNLCGKAGGATKENNRLKKENEDLKAEIKELKSNRYRIKELPPTKPKKQIIGVKKGISSGAVKIELKKINELREKEEV